jgi:hypothetical protein
MNSSLAVAFGETTPHTLNRVTQFIPRPIWAIGNSDIGFIVEDYSDFHAQEDASNLMNEQRQAA